MLGTTVKGQYAENKQWLKICKISCIILMIITGLLFIIGFFNKENGIAAMALLFFICGGVMYMFLHKVVKPKNRDCAISFVAFEKDLLEIYIKPDSEKERDIKTFIHKGTWNRQRNIMTLIDSSGSKYKFNCDKNSFKTLKQYGLNLSIEKDNNSLK